MNLKKKTNELISTHKGTEQSLFRALKDLLNDYKRSKIPRIKYDLTNHYTEFTPNRTALSESIMIKGMSERSIYERLVRYEKDGFNASRETKALTDEVCRVLKCERDELLQAWNG